MNILKACVIRHIIHIALALLYVVTPFTASAETEDFARARVSLERLTEELNQQAWSAGYYSFELLEPLQQLANAQLAANRFDDVEETIDRAAQITRIEYGLYTSKQYPFLQQAIEVEMIRGDWDEVVEKVKHFTWLIGAEYEGDASTRLNLLEWVAEVHLRGYLEDSREREAYHLIRKTTLQEVAVQYAQAFGQANDLEYADLLLALANSYGMEAAAIRKRGRTSYRLRILVPGTDLLADRDEALNVRYAIGLEKLEMRRDVIASIDTADYMDLIAAEEDISHWQDNFRRLDPEDYVSSQTGDD